MTTHTVIVFKPRDHKFSDSGVYVLPLVSEEHFDFVLGTIAKLYGYTGTIEELDNVAEWLVQDLTLFPTVGIT